MPAGDATATMKLPRKLQAAALLATLALVVLAYLPGLRGPFVFDDYPNILNNPAVAVTEFTPQALRAAALSNNSGPLGRPLAALSFGIDHYRAGGFYPLAFKLSNLAIHLLNVLLVYALAGRLARRLGAGEMAPAGGAVLRAVVGPAPAATDQRAVRGAAHDQPGGDLHAGGDAVLAAGAGRLGRFGRGRCRR